MLLQKRGQFQLENWHKSIQQDANLNPLAVLICTLIKLASHSCVSRHHAILWHGHRSREPSSRVHALTVSKQGRRPSPATGMLQHGWSLCADSTVNGSCQQHEAGSTSELSQAASPTAERKKKRDGRFLNGGLCDQALVSLCVVLVLVIRLLVSGKKTYLIYDAALWMLARQISSAL